jgi:hypothetical protein
MVRTIEVGWKSELLRNGLSVTSKKSLACRGLLLTRLCEIGILPQKQPVQSLGTKGWLDRELRHSLYRRQGRE